MAYSVKPVSPSLEDRNDLVAFLMNSPGTVYSEVFWKNRLKHWWDDNPAASPDAPRGWILYCDAQIVGFLGCIPLHYRYEGNEVLSVTASSWRVMEAHRSQSLRLFMPLYKLSQTMPVLNTSPNPAVKQILEKSGFLSRAQAHQHFFLMNPQLGGLLAMVFGKGKGFPDLSEQARLVTNLNEVKGIVSPVMQSGRLEKSISVEYLRWQLSSPVVRLQFLGSVDPNGVLSSYLVLQESRVKGIKSWMVVDWFSANPMTEEIGSMVGYVCQNPSFITGSSNFGFLVMTCLDDHDYWSSAPALYRREIPALHYFSLPKTLAVENKRCVIAEGDCLL